jgi:hypothetical protein
MCAVPTTHIDGGHASLWPPYVRFVIAGLDPAIHHPWRGAFCQGDGYAGQARVCAGTDLPVVSRPLAKNIWLFRLVETAIEPIPSRAHQEGRTRRHERGTRDAMDADGAARRAVLSRTAKSCGPDASTPASSLAEIRQGDGDKQARSPGRSRRKPLKPSRRECRNVSANLW